jgi:hypothetical protein
MNSHRSHRTMENESLSIAGRVEAPHKRHPGREVATFADSTFKIANVLSKPIETARPTLLDCGSDS